MNNPQFPIYLPTKGRYQNERRLTSKALTRMGVPHYMVVEEQEYDDYVEACRGSTATVIILDPLYKRNYELCDDFGLTKSTGPGPARNFAWDHSVSNGFKYHWVQDDNINEFLRLHDNKKIRFGDGTPFKAMEDFVLRYKNITMAGPQYRAFAPQNAELPPFVINTRIYSCNLIKNDACWQDGRPFRWRGRYNEDTILSLDMLVEGFCTVQFNAFLQDKVRTQVLGGGNSAEFYFKEGTAAKSQMLKDVYPKYTELTWKFGRIHHEVNYRPFKSNRLEFADNYRRIEGTNNYGLELNTGWKNLHGDKSK
jgi:hypothetical protein